MSSIVRQLSKAEIEAYMNAAQSAMFQYQMIEQALKAYIFYAHRIVQSHLPKELSFGYKEEEYDSMPLERLLKVFAKFTHNQALLKQLRALQGPRNHVAHRSFALVFLSSVSVKVNFEQEFKKVSEASASSVTAFMALKEELDSISKVSARLAGPNGVA